MPILAHVLVSAKDGLVSYRASNLRHEISGNVPAAGVGSFAVNAREFVGALSSLEGDNTKIEHANNRLTIKAAGKRSFKLPTLPAEEFPSAMNVGGSTATLPAGLLPRLISSVSFAARQDADRAEQNVVRLYRADGKLRAAAPNGLGMLAILSVESAAELAISIPIETTRLLLEHEGETLVTTSANAMAFKMGHAALASREPAGEFPPVDAVIQSFPPPLGVVSVDAKTLLNSVKAVRRASNDICLTFGGGALGLKTIDDGASDELEVGGDAPALRIWLPADQLAMAVGVLEGDVEIAVARELDAFRLRQGDWAAWIMPIREESVKSRG
jgi:DNA polymerase III sliding clamp (beta) subunit (PCNA family)